MVRVQLRGKTLEDIQDIWFADAHQYTGADEVERARLAAIAAIEGPTYQWRKVGKWGGYAIFDMPEEDAKLLAQELWENSWPFRIRDGGEEPETLRRYKAQQDDAVRLAEAIGYTIKK